MAMMATDLSPTSKVESTPDEAGALSQALYERYRCPRHFFRFVLNGPLSSEKGHFRFGPNVTCYGSLCSPGRAPEYDALRDLLIEDATLGLPFDPTEVIENLRLERYADAPRTTFPNNILRKLYYLLRPFTNLAIRKQIQRLYARSAKGLRFPKWPVDTTVEDLCEQLLLLTMQAKGIASLPFVWFWPDGATSCHVMTHDVETRAGWNRCADLMDVDDSFGIKASFEIVPEKRYAVSNALLVSMRDRGFEVAVQDLNHDGKLFDNKPLFLRRVQAINRYGREYRAKGFRAAVLYREPDWYDALDFCFDMSIPNVAHLDAQRGGCCTVMPYFIGDVVEIPVTTTQDYALFHILNEQTIDLWKTQTELITRKNGLASFIVHPDYAMQRGMLPLYKDLLAYLCDLRKQMPIWQALPSEVDGWWRARNRMSVVEDGKSWRIEGDESGRAVLAYAKNVNGKLVYELVRPN
jgi:hypothetical protein